MRLLGANYSENCGSILYCAAAEISVFQKPFLLISLLRGLFFIGAGMIGTAVISAVVIGAVVIRSRQRHDPFHFTFQAGFNRFRSALSPSDTAHIRRVEIQLTGDAPVKTPK
jgi:hypothetical protein